MSVDVPAVLYSVIDEIGKAKIRADVSSDIAQSKQYCKQILDMCMTKLGASADEETVASFCEALLHFMLTVSLLPSQRKINIRGVDVDIVIPSTRILLSSPEKSILIQFIKTRADVERISKLDTLQPIAENIWLVTPSRLVTTRPRYDFDGDFSFSEIINDIYVFVTRNGVSGLKLFQGQ